MGGYAAITAVGLGVNVFVAMIVVAPIVVGLIGLVVERLVIRHLYGRLVDTMLATWGLSLFFIGVVTMIFGNTTSGISTPIAGFAVGDYQINGYNFFVILVAVVLVLLMLLVLRSTRLGLIARGTMQRADMASALGYSPDRIYMATFFCGSALSGLAGAVFAPLVGLVPSSGGTYIAKAFITVIAGGPSLIAGLVSKRRPVRPGQPGLHLRHFAGHRRGRPSRRRRHPVAPAAAGRDRPLLQKVPVMSGWTKDAVVTLVVAALAIWLLPYAISTYTLTILVIYGMLAFSLGLIWGFGGILCFGQAAFFGLGAYTYAIAAINFGESTVPMVLAILLPFGFAAILGAMMFYGRLTDVYLGVITLVVTLILFKFMNSTAGPQYVIGEARLGGFNGIPGFQTLNVPGDPEAYIYGDALYYFCALCLLIVYLLVSALLRSSFGRIAVGIRENETRIALLGYDVRGAQDPAVRHRRGDRRICRRAVCQLGRDRHPQPVFSGSVGRNHRLVHRRRARNPAGADPRPPRGSPI